MSELDKEALRETLSRLYADVSKHSTYQTVPDFVERAINYQVHIDEGWRGDRVRLRYLQRAMASEPGSRWADFGANTGFFSLSLAHADRARHVLAIEGNPNHARFIATIAEAFELKNIEVLARAIAIDGLDTLPRQDVLLHLNVLHHAGADFDKGIVTGPCDFLEYATRYLERLHHVTETLVFQIGTNLWGDKTQPLIDYTDDIGKLVLLAHLLQDSGWKIERVAYPRKSNDGTIEYDDLPAGLHLADRIAIGNALASFNLQSHRGEFYRRPLFVCSND